MFKNNDKSLFLLRKIVNVALFISMCLCVIAGVVMISLCKTIVGSTQYIREYVNTGMIIGGVLTMILGPIICQIVWLLVDLKFNAILDVKLIRNSCYNINGEQSLSYLFFKNKKSTVVDSISIFEKLKQYKELYDANILTEAEYEQIKAELLNKNICENTKFSNAIKEVKKLKTYVDEKILTEEEFSVEKAKILKK